MPKKHYLVIGGTRGIGLAFVKALAEKQQTVSVIGLGSSVDICQDFPNVLYRQVDLTDQERLKDVLSDILLNNGKLNYLVFFQRYRGKGDDWVGEIQTSLTATKYIIEQTENDFDRIEDNSIVIVSSIASLYIADEQPLSYHVAKAGLNQMMRYYAVTLGPKGIRVNCVSPSTVLKEESKDYYLKNKKLGDLYKVIIPLGRMGTSEEIVQVILFLCSSQSSFITGQNIVVDGGLSLKYHESMSRQLTSLDS